MTKQADMSMEVTDRPKDQQTPPRHIEISLSITKLSEVKLPNEPLSLLVG